MSVYLVGGAAAATVPMLSPFIRNTTRATESSSTAVAVRLTLPVRATLPVTPGEKSDTIGGAMSASALGCAAFHCATALFQ